jgi:hypothetical protein
MRFLPRARQQFSGNPDSIVAAGFRVTKRDTDDLRRLISPWQSRAFSYYDQLGEIKFASQFYSRMLSPLRLYAAELDANGDWVETDFQPAVDALERIQDPGGGRESLLGSYGRLMFLVGECYLLCSVDPDTGLEQWEMLSTDELRIQSGTYIRYRAPSLPAENLDEIPDEDFEPVGDNSAVAYRLWKRHPRYSMMADSTMQGVLDLCEELLLLTRAVRARARSRLAGSGILAISEDFSYAPLEPVGDEDIRVDPLLSDLTKAMVTPIQNEGTASAVVPLVLRGPTDAIDKGIKHIQIVDPTQLYPETGLRTECIHRIALGLDMPPEILEGKTDANHWTAWQISDDEWQSHGQPVASQLVNDLTSAYFAPELRSRGVADYRRYKIAYDPSDVINKPDQTKNAQSLYDRRAVSKEYLRRSHGVDEADAMPEDELNETIGVAVRDGSLALYGIPSVRAGGIEPEPGVVEDAGVAPTGEPVKDTTGASSEPGPPAEGVKPDASDLQASGNGRRNGAEALALARLAGAADLAVLRAREAAGNRIKSRAKRDPETAALVEGVAARDIAATLGRDRVRALGISERELVESALPLLEETLRLWGVLDAEAVRLIAEKIEQHAVRTLYDERPSPLPPQFQSYAAGLLRG